MTPGFVAKFVIQNAFFRRALATGARFIGRADDDAVFNASAIHLRLLHAWAHAPAREVRPPGATGAMGADATRHARPYIVYGPFYEWFAWDTRRLHGVCFAYNPNRQLGAHAHFERVRHSLSDLAHHEIECVQPGVARAFPFAGGALTVYSRPLARALLESPQLAADEARVLAEVQKVDAPEDDVETAGGVTLRESPLWEDVYYGHLMMRVAGDAPLALIKAPFIEGRHITQSLADCRLHDVLYAHGRLSGVAYHGLKSPTQFEPFFREGNSWLLHHDARERLKCNALLHNSTASALGAAGAWSMCSFSSASGASMLTDMRRRAR